MKKAGNTILGTVSALEVIGAGYGLGQAIEAKTEQTSVIFSDPGFKEHLSSSLMSDEPVDAYHIPVEASDAETAAVVWSATGAALGAAGLAGLGMSFRIWRNGKKEDERPEIIPEVPSQ